MNKSRPLIVSVLLLLLSSAAAMASQTDLYEAERDLFIDARKALSKGDTKEFQRLRAQLGDHYPIAHYLDYLQTHKQFRSEVPSTAQLDALNAFEQDTNDKELTKRLTVLLQKRAASVGKWSLYRSVSQSKLAPSRPCLDLQADAHDGGLKGLNDAALALWVEPKKHSKKCAALLDKLEVQQVPPIKAIWQRIYKAMDAAKPDYADSVVRYLSRKDRNLVVDWIKARKNPQAFLKSGKLASDTVFNRRAVTDLVLLWSKDDPVAAMNHWLSTYQNYRFYNDRYYDTHRLLAMRGAYRRLPEAYEWLNGVPARDDDLELKEWRIRAALFSQDWVNVFSSIKRLPPEEQKEDHWAYWKARVLEEAGHINLAAEIYVRLSKLPTYHGFLSADKINVDYPIEDVPIEADEKTLQELSMNSALIRAREFHAVNIKWEGRREWNALLAGSKPARLAAMAVLAKQWGLHDRALYIAGKANKKQALSIRFPVLYEQQVSRLSAKHNIPKDWVYGVMRRESGFIQDVKSHAGAIGLMQLMPKTAKYVAELQGEKDWNGDLIDAETNIGFGTFYLRHVLNRFDNHQILATASYNAGPTRVNKWLPPENMPADVWIDAIPYSETRRYVRAVMAYSIIYEWHLTKKPARLSSKLVPVPAAPGV